ncbi:hypothetical protein [Paramesorhizobium deserti]|uniref:hypothetical protein n=1 Tax=Paramesorhizobium deserti TaxID=1494590 RepID=UPI00129019FB|nr:hypothetical protein [Paramesorhizobium deserti]
MKRALLSIILLSHSSVSLAEDPPELPPDVFTQVLSQTYNGRIYSPAAQFGNLLEIGVFAEFVNIAFGDGLPIPVDVRLLTGFGEGPCFYSSEVSISARSITQALMRINNK